VITALVLDGHPEALAMTLSALVPGVVDGLIGDAVVLSKEVDGAAAVIAEASGATLVPVTPADDPWRTGAQAARRDWLLCLEAGDVPVDDWVRALDRFVSLAGPERRHGRLTRRHATLRARLTGLVEAGFSARRLRAGDLVHRTLLETGEPRARLIRIAAAIRRSW
jgi:hypothetical protein